MQASPPGFSSAATAATAGAANEKVEEAAAAIGEGPITPARRRCVASLLRRKARLAIASLENMGFPEWECRLAVMSFGSDADAAVSWLIEGVSESSRLEGERCALEAAPVDISSDIRSLREVYTLGLPQQGVDEAVAAHDGDIDVAVASLFAKPGTWSAPAAATNHVATTQRASTGVSLGAGFGAMDLGGPATPPRGTSSTWIGGGGSSSTTSDSGGDGNGSNTGGNRILDLVRGGSGNDGGGGGGDGNLWSSGPAQPPRSGPPGLVGTIDTSGGEGSAFFGGASHAPTQSRFFGGSGGDNDTRGSASSFSDASSLFGGGASLFGGGAAFGGGGGLGLAAGGSLFGGGGAPGGKSSENLLGGFVGASRGAQRVGSTGVSSAAFGLGGGLFGGSMLDRSRGGGMHAGGDIWGGGGDGNGGGVGSTLPAPMDALRAAASVADDDDSNLGWR